MTKVKKFHRSEYDEHPYETLRFACYVSCTYVAIVHLSFICYALSVMDEQNENEYFNFYFELSDADASLVRWLTVLSSFVALGVSLTVVNGIKNEKRSQLILYITVLIIEMVVFTAAGLYLIFCYFDEGYSLYNTAKCWLIDGLHLISLAFVVAQYRVMKYYPKVEYVIVDA